jgi:hypothetical protein
VGGAGFCDPGGTSAGRTYEMNGDPLGSEREMGTQLRTKDRVGAGGRGEQTGPGRYNEAWLLRSAGGGHFTQHHTLGPF